jgi:alkylation response protein AidB-like acyl-CoA dehydrogenase
VDFKLSATEVAFRDELRAWLERHCPRDWERTRQVLSREARAESLIGWQRELHAAGYVGLHWPVAYGGRGGSVMEQAIFYEEMVRAGAPELANAIGLDMAGPAIMVHGTEEQKCLHLRRILAAEHIFCQGFSEPGAGSDLASLGTRAERKPGAYVLTGQKVWTSFAHYANWCTVLARTDPTAPRHRGLTYFLVDMTSPGFSRAGPSPARDPLVRQRLAQLYIDVETLRYANLRVLTQLVKGEPAGPAGSASKLFFSETWQKVAELGLELQGAYATLWAGSEWAVDDGRWQYRALRSRGNTIQGGTSEVMRNILAERVLGLPKD